MRAVSHAKQRFLLIFHPVLIVKTNISFPPSCHKTANRLHVTAEKSVKLYSNACNPAVTVMKTIIS